MSSLHTAISTPSFCSFGHGHPYIPIHFLKMFFILVTITVTEDLSPVPKVYTKKSAVTKEAVMKIRLRIVDLVCLLCIHVLFKVFETLTLYKKGQLCNNLRYIS